MPPLAACGAVVLWGWNGRWVCEARLRGGTPRVVAPGRVDFSYLERSILGATTRRLRRSSALVNVREEHYCAAKRIGVWSWSGR